MEGITGFWEILIEFFSTPIFKLGSSSITLQGLILFLIYVVLLVVFSGFLKKLIQRRLSRNFSFDKSLSQTIATAIRYAVLVIGLIIIFQTSGFDLSTLNVLAGALGVGIGFGLQNITNNFISGIIILFERPIKIGDRVEVAGVVGDVVSISARFTTVVTNDNVTYLVPNSEFISSTVINWSHNDRNIRIRVPLGVSYNEDPNKVRQILLEIAHNEEGALKTPPPRVFFTDFGDSSLDFELAVWTTDFINRPGVLKSHLYFKIFERFKEENIEIPFPQRDLHVRSSDLKKFN